MSGRLAGKKALITGGAQGLGYAFAKQFIAEGAQVVLTDVQSEKVKAAADEVGAFAGLSHDVASEEDWQSVAARAAATMGGVTTLIHNAGIGSFGNVETETLDQYRKVMAVNTDAAFIGTQAVLPYMKKAEGGSVVIISSVAGLTAHPDMLAYHVSKAAVAMTAKCIAKHCAKAGYDITCNSVHPVFTKTPIIEPLIAAKGDRDAGEAALVRGIPLRRLGEPEEVSNMVTYLASNEARFVTGAEFVIDGGMMA